MHKNLSPLHVFGDKRCNQRKPSFYKNYYLLQKQSSFCRHILATHLFLGYRRPMGIKKQPQHSTIESSIRF